MRTGDTFTLKLYATAQGTTSGGHSSTAGAFMAYHMPDGFVESLSPDGEMMVLIVQVLNGPHRFARTDSKRPSPEDWLESAELQRVGWREKN